MGAGSNAAILSSIDFRHGKIYSTQKIHSASYVWPTLSPLHYAVRIIINRGIIQVDLSAPKPKLMSASVNMYLGGWSLDDPICDKKLGVILLLQGRAK